MIRYPVTPAKLRAAIKKLDPRWFEDAEAVLAGLSTPPRSTEFKPLWSKIKGIYIELQHSKCCYCEKPLEGKIEQDVEHFRPKAEVKPWKVPARLASEGIVVRQPTDGSSEPGYTRMAYVPFNYGTACKTCNSTLKRNLFPIEGSRDPGATDPARTANEKALLLYPIGRIDGDPENFIEFIGLSPVPKQADGFSRRRALVTIEIFRLDDSKLRDLFKSRAYLVRLLFLELARRDTAATGALRAKHEAAIAILTSPASPFTSCTRAFKRLYEDDPARAEAIADECLRFIGTRSARIPRLGLR